MVNLPNCPEPIIMCAQHFGYVDFVSVVDPETKQNKLKLLDGGIQLSTNSIFYLEATRFQTKPKDNPQQVFCGEYALATYLGLAFIHVFRNKNAKKQNTSDQPATGSKRPPPPFEVSKQNEVYFKDKVVMRFSEYTEGEFAVCIAKEEYVYLLSRKNQQIKHKIRNPQGKSCNYEVSPIPNFHLRNLPYLFIRDDKCLMLLNIAEGKFLKLHQAKYESSQCYKGMQLVVRQQNTGSNDKPELKVNSSIFSDSDALGEEGNNQALSLFSLFLLSHKPDLSSKLIKLDFDESFIQNLSAHSRE